MALRRSSSGSRKKKAAPLATPAFTRPELTPRQTALLSCQRFWGGRGAPGDFDVLSSDLEPLSLPDCRAVRARIPNLRTGPTGERVARIDSLLGELIEEKR